MNILRLVLGCSRSFQRIDLHEHLLVCLLLPVLVKELRPLVEYRALRPLLDLSLHMGRVGNHLHGRLSREKTKNTTHPKLRFLLLELLDVDARCPGTDTGDAVASCSTSDRRLGFVRRRSDSLQNL